MADCGGESSFPYSFKFVFIPADDLLPIEEKQLQVNDSEEEVECLTAFMKNHLSQTTGKVDTKVLQTQLQEHFKKAQGSNAGNENAITEDMLQTIASIQMVDIIPLLPHSKQNGYIGVNMYVDDKGISKNSCINNRASEIASCCGNPTTVRGDVVVARLYESDEDYRRHDFTIEECASDAEWIKTAYKWNCRDKLKEPQRPKCNVLGCYAEGTMKCGRCKQAAYCSKDCQREDWKKHKLVCEPK